MAKYKYQIVPTVELEGEVDTELLELNPDWFEKLYSTKASAWNAYNREADEFHDSGVDSVTVIKVRVD